MKKYQITGGLPLSGKLRVQGSKNAVLPMMAAAVLQEETVELKGCPKISDVFCMEKMLQSLGAQTAWEGDTLQICCREISGELPETRLAGKLRSSILFLGSLLGRNGYGRVGSPGGCSIGRRPTDLHEMALRALGAGITKTENGITAYAGKLSGNHIRFPKTSVGATENAILAAVCAEGTTVLSGCAREPEVQWLCRFLRSMGASVEGESRGCVIIRGQKRLHGCTFQVPPDRIAAGTWILAGAAVRGTVELDRAPVEELGAVLKVYGKMGGQYRVSGDKLFTDSSRVGRAVPYVETESYPGFPTDLQSLLLAAAATLPGKTIVRETVFEDRFAAVRELKKMGARAQIRGSLIEMEKSRLRGAQVAAGDLRGGAALVIAALAAEGNTEVEQVQYIERGYERFPEQLQQLGARIHMIEE